MKEIVISDYKSDALREHLLALYNCFKGTRANEKVKFNLNGLTWASPLVILPICAYANNTGSIVECGGTSAAVKDYLQWVSFPNGVNTISAFEQQIQKFKSYVPISILRKQDREQRERLETIFLEMICKTLGNIQGAETSIYYPVSELVTNIFDHSRKDEGYAFGQYYSSKNFLDMCIVDCGRGLRSAYQEELGLSLSDEESIGKALEGFSTKKDKERGYGIRSSIKVVCEGLGGGFILISGSAAFISVGDKKAMVALPNFHWQGVIIAYRMPRPTHPIDIMPFVE